MASLRRLIAIPLAACLIVLTVASVTAASPRQLSHVPAQPSGPVFPFLPFVDFGFSCDGPFTGEDNIQVEDGQITSTTSLVVLTNQQRPTLTGQGTLPGINLPGIELPSISFDADLMKCLFTYPAGSVKGAPFIDQGFECEYSNESIGTHVFGQSLMIVRETWAILVCIGTDDEVGSGSTQSGGIGRGSR